MYGISNVNAEVTSLLSALPYMLMLYCTQTKISSFGKVCLHVHC